MGGKNPLLVMQDANLDRAVDLAVAGAMQLAGQKCTATSRVIVQAAVAKEFVKRLVAKVSTLKTGNPLDETTDVGPVIDAAALEGILNYIETGKKEGAKLEIGGRRLERWGFGQRFLLRADGIQRCEGRYDDCAGRDIRAGAGGF